MCSVLMALVVLFGNGIVQSNQLLGQNTQNLADELAVNVGSAGAWAENLPKSAYEIVVPAKIDATGKPCQGKHYRKRDTTLWDYNTAFIFQAFGESFHLNLTLDNAFISPNFVVQHLFGNQTWIEESGSNLRDCFYTGHLSGRPNSVAAVSLCHGLHGSFRSSNEDYFIQPIYNDTSWDSESQKAHIVYKRSSLLMNKNNQSHCGFPDSKLTNKSFNVQCNDSYNAINFNFLYPNIRIHRLKRSISYQRHVEVMVAVDAKMYNYHGENLEQYVLTLMSIVALIYKDPSIGNDINIVVVRLFVIKNEEDGPVISSSAADTLRNFCKWQQMNNRENDRDPLHHDTAVLITRVFSSVVSLFSC